MLKFKLEMLLKHLLISYSQQNHCNCIVNIQPFAHPNVDSELSLFLSLHK